MSFGCATGAAERSRQQTAQPAARGERTAPCEGDNARQAQMRPTARSSDPGNPNTSMPTTAAVVVSTSVDADGKPTTKLGADADPCQAEQVPTDVVETR